MNSYLIYLLEVSLIFGCLVSLYYLLFRKLTFHSFNRFVLLLLIPVSLIIPELKVGFKPLLRTEFEESGLYEKPNVKAEIQNNIQQTQTQTDFVVYLGILYWLGFGVFALLLVRNVFKLFQIKRSSQKFPGNGYQLLMSDVPAVFSCCRWVFIPRGTSYAYDDPILRHEEAHVRMMHTMDLIAVELFLALTWFNPFVFLFRKLLKSVHEYQADEYVLHKNISKSNYLTAILHSLVSTENMSLASNFRSSTIKNRIEMITGNKSNKVQSIRYVLMVPAFVLLLVAFAAFAGTTPSIFPIKNGSYSKITSPFGVNRKDPITKKMSIHRGIDIAAAKGTPVMATGGGVILKAKMSGDYGNLVVIDHGDGIETWYAHLDDMNIKVGDYVKAGEIIGHVGNTGKNTAPHLHYEVRKDGKRVDPEDYYGKN